MKYTKKKMFKNSICSISCSSPVKTRLLRPIPIHGSAAQRRPFFTVLCFSRTSQKDPRKVPWMSPHSIDPHYGSPTGPWWTPEASMIDPLTRSGTLWRGTANNHPMGPQLNSLIDLSMEFTKGTLTLSPTPWNPLGSNNVHICGS